MISCDRFILVISLAAHDEDLSLARIKGKAIGTGPICDRSAISSYAIKCEIKIRRRKMVIELHIVGKDHHLREVDY